MTRSGKATVGRLAAAAAATVIAGAVITASAFGLPPFSTTPKSSTASGAQAELSGAAAGCHQSFDRFVVHMRVATPGYDVRYVRRIVADGSGKPVPLQGSKRIRIVIRPARGRTSSGANLLPGVITPHCPNLRQVKEAGDFEGVVTFGLGLARKTGFRVFRLTRPARLVIDVSH